MRIACSSPCPKNANLYSQIYTRSPDSDTLKLLMIVWALIFLSAIFPSLAFAFGPTVEADQAGTSLQVGSNFFLQTVSVNKHFSVRTDKPNSYFLQQERPDLEEMKKASGEREKDQQIQRQLLNLSWMLGYAYYRSSANDPVSGTFIYDEAHAVELGLAWEAGKVFDITASGAYQVLPAENYSQGIYGITMDYTFPLSSIPDTSEPATNPMSESEAYYVNKARDAEKPHIPAVDRFPNLKVGYQAQFQEHTKSATTSGRSAGVGLPDTTLNVALSGLEATLNFSRTVKLRLDWMVYLYDNTPAGFLANTTIGAFRQKLDLGIAELEGTTQFLLNFPKRSLNGTLTTWLDPSVKLDLILHYASYDATSTIGAGTISSTVDGAGFLSWAFSDRWKLGGALDVTLGSGVGNSTSATGGVSLGYAL
jgi:hypothetical protein